MKNKIILEFTEEEIQVLMQMMVDANVPVKVFLMIDQKVKEVEIDQKVKEVEKADDIHTNLETNHII